MQFRNRYSTLLAAGAVALGVTTLTTAVQSAVFYAGKTVTVISPVPGGSGFDRPTKFSPL